MVSISDIIENIKNKKEILGMHKKIIGSIMVAAVALMAVACSNQSNDGGETVKTQVTEQEQTTAEEKTGTELRKMTEQGNPLEVDLSEIAEKSGDGYNAWLKISTVYDETLSMYNIDSVPAGTTGIVVDFEISGMDIDKSELHWCYEIVSNGETVSLWDTSSPADKLTITEDGKYRMVFDAQKALGGTIDSIGSLQIVFPGFDETTSAKVKVTSAGYTDALAQDWDFVTEKAE